MLYRPLLLPLAVAIYEPVAIFGWLTALVAITVTVGCCYTYMSMWPMAIFGWLYALLADTVTVGCCYCPVAIFGWLTALLTVIITAGCCYMYNVQCT